MMRIREILRQVYACGYYDGENEIKRNSKTRTTPALADIKSCIKEKAGIMSDEQIAQSPNPDYARAYYQGKFDLMMDLFTP